MNELPRIRDVSGERATYREVVLDSRSRISLAKIPRKVKATRYRVTLRADGSITLTPLMSVPLTRRTE